MFYLDYKYLKELGYLKSLDVKTNSKMLYLCYEVNNCLKVLSYDILEMFFGIFLSINLLQDS